jgi:hypothetical protein
LDIVKSLKGGIRTCETPYLYAKRAADGAVTPLDDPRPARTIAVTRYEVYWIMALNYNADRWILLVDSRDTYFQADPFTDVPRHTDPTGKSGLLYYFGENVDATRIGKSKQNLKWIQNAYGLVTADFLKDKPTICSGATLAEQVALETYVRAMVAESDETGTVLLGADQGFHNFMYYSHKLANAEQIHAIVVFDQGTGIVNNLGALRTAELEEWGNGKIVKEFVDDKGKQGWQVFNWDGSLTQVVHQYDRHKRLTKYMYQEKGHEFVSEWRKQNATLTKTS